MPSIGLSAARGPVAAPFESPRLWLRMAGPACENDTALEARGFGKDHSKSVVTRSVSEYCCLFPLNTKAKTRTSVVQKSGFALSYCVLEERSVVLDPEDTSSKDNTKRQGDTHIIRRANV